MIVAEQLQLKPRTAIEAVCAAINVNLCSQGGSGRGSKKGRLKYGNREIPSGASMYIMYFDSSN